MPSAVRSRSDRSSTRGVPEPRSEAGAEAARVFREVHGQAIATLTRVLGSITLAEDAVQTAFEVALERWERDGIPPNPAGWIITTARRRGIDVLRREDRGRALAEEAATARIPADPPDAWIEEGPVADDQLRLIFTCCHPALAIEHRVALTLRLLGGLSVAEVARSFLVTEATMAKRLVRAKHKIAAAGIPYRVPDGSELPRRLSGVLTVLYLIYNTGADDVERSPLRADAIRLVRSLRSLLPTEPETGGLLALMLLNESRMGARRTAEGVVLLRDQDRRLWDAAMIDEAVDLLSEARRLDRPGPFQLQAAIQAVHCTAPAFEATDWGRIVELYDELLAVTPSPVVALNRAIALGEEAGSAEGLSALEALSPELDRYHLFHAARGTMLRAVGHAEAARAAYERAAELAPTDPDRRFLADRLAELSD